MWSFGRMSFRIDTEHTRHERLRLKNMNDVAPDQSDNISILTANKRGRSTSRLNELNELFVDQARTAQGPVLDLGCAFGIAALAALHAGAKVIANDIDPAHLAAVHAAAPTHLLNRLQLSLAAFPSELELPSHSLAVIHASNLLNFLSGEEIEEGFRKVARWLMPGGRFLSISGTPYAANIRDFIPRYEHNRSNRLRWPGECHDLHSISQHPTMKELPQFLHLLDPDVLCRSAQEAGLIVEQSKWIHRRDTPSYIALDGRENVIFVARVP
jgi:SAM-dependent methyltransferase